MHGDCGILGMSECGFKGWFVAWEYLGMIECRAVERGLDDQEFCLDGLKS